MTRVAIVTGGSRGIGRAAWTSSWTPRECRWAPALTLILARERQGRDITVDAVAPGPTATALFL